MQKKKYIFIEKLEAEGNKEIKLHSWYPAIRDKH